MGSVLDTLLKILHVLVAAVLIGVVLLQQGRGGGLGAAFGGGGATQVFGGRGAGNILTKATAIAATMFMLTSVSLAYRSSSADRALAAKLELEKEKKAERGTHHKEHPETSAVPSGAKPPIDLGVPSSTPAPPVSAPSDSATAPAPSATAPAPSAKAPAPPTPTHAFGACPRSDACRGRGHARRGAARGHRQRPARGRDDHRHRTRAAPGDERVRPVT